MEHGLEQHSGMAHFDVTVCWREALKIGFPYGWRSGYDETSSLKFEPLFGAGFWCDYDRRRRQRTLLNKPSSPRTAFLANR